MRHAKTEPTREHKGSAPERPPLVDDELFRSAFHNSPAMQSAVRAADGVIVEVNTFLQKMRRTREQVIGKIGNDVHRTIAFIQNREVIRSKLVKANGQRT